MSPLLEDQQKMLLHMAREAVRSYLSCGPAATLERAASHENPPNPTFRSQDLSQSRAAFVSIHQGAELRGCIGNIHPSGPLDQTVRECAISAAVGDPRFPALTLEELAGVSFEISVLSPMEEVRQIDEIEIGTHGLLITKRHGRGLLLPQVATDQGWDRERLLSETCRKAGLDADDWKNGATIQRFTAQVFSEQRIHHSSTHLAPS